MTKSYQHGRKVALKEFEAVFTPGIYGILGPNGAGKSTLMNLITDQLHPDQGEVLYQGKPIRELGSKYRSILGFMPQQQGLYDDFTGRRFLWYMGALKGLSASQIRKRIKELLEVVNLSKDADRRLGTYSGGMKQRILIAQALLNDPEILILDEPTAGVDPKERIRLRNFISTIAQHKIVLLATHVVSDIEYIAKEIILMKKGKLLRKNTPTEIVAEMEGRVYEAIISSEQLPAIEDKYKVCNIKATTDGLHVRFISEEEVRREELQADLATPHLEDVYLNFFE